MKKVKREAAAQRRPAQSERKNRAFSAKRQAVKFETRVFQTENTLKDKKNAAPWSSDEETTSYPRQTGVPSTLWSGKKSMVEKRRRCQPWPLIDAARLPKYSHDTTPVRSIGVYHTTFGKAVRLERIGVAFSVIRSFSEG